MKYKFQAKNIQHLLRIKKIRYEYLTSKLNIKPDVEEAEGTGRAHLYSFKNLLQIATAHHANEMGLSLRIVKNLLDDLENYKDLVEPELFDAVKNTSASIYIVYHYGFPIVCIRGIDLRFYTDVEKKILELKEELKKMRNKDHKELLDYQISSLTSMAKIIDNFPPDKTFKEIWPEMSDGYISINFGTIKNKMLSYLELS
jgi:hypothetical protein